MTQIDIERLTKKLRADTGKGYSLCKISAENALALFDGITEDNAFDATGEILAGIPGAGNIWSVVFRERTRFAVGLETFSGMKDALFGVLYN